MRILAPLVGLLALFSQPAAAATSPQLGSLERQLAALVAGKSGDFGIAAMDLRTNETVCIRCDQPFPMASTVKVAVAAAYLAQVDHGRRSLSDVIAGRSARSLMEAMLIHSDNRATDLLMNNLGGPTTIDQWVRWNGLSGLRVDRTIARLLSDRRDLFDARDSSTPTAMIEMLRKIDKGNVLSTSSHSYLMDVMARCMTGKNRMRALLPVGTRVEHKTGTLNGLTGDVGYITLQDGRRIAVAFFARGGNDRPRTIAEAARAIYYGFAQFGSRAYSSIGAL